MTKTNKQTNGMVALIIPALSLFVTLPFLKKEFLFADDWLFHFNRILGIAEGLKSGQFPVRIYPQVFYGAGYQAPQFYPDLFLYLPAVLVRLGVPLLGAVYIFHFIINFFTTYFAWFSMRKMNASVTASLLVAAAWCFCPYRLTDLYLRYALGETLALCFLPLVVAGFYEIFISEEPKPYLLALGMSGVLLSHVLTSLFAVAFMVLFSLLFVDRLVKRPKTLISLGGAAVLSFLLTAFFLIPFLQADRASTFLPGLAKEIWNECITARDLLLPISQDHNHIYFVGFTFFLCFVVAVAFLFQKEENTLHKRLVLSFLVTGVFLLVMCTGAFPWKALCQRNATLGSVLTMIQFPWRLVGPGCLLVLFAGGLAFTGEYTFFDKKRFVPPVLVAICCLAGFLPFCMFYPNNRRAVLSMGETPSSVIAQDYLIFFTDPNVMEDALPISSEGTEVKEYEKNGTNLMLTVSAPAEGWVDTTLFNFVGYVAVDENGNLLEATYGENNRLRVLFHEPYDGVLYVKYVGKNTWKLWNGVSFFSLICCCALVRLDKKTLKLLPKLGSKEGFDKK